MFYILPVSSPYIDIHILSFLIVYYLAIYLHIRDILTLKFRSWFESDEWEIPLAYLPTPLLSLDLPFSFSMIVLIEPTLAMLSVALFRYLLRIVLRYSTHIIHSWSTNTHPTPLYRISSLKTEIKDQRGLSFRWWCHLIRPLIQLVNSNNFATFSQRHVHPSPFLLLNAPYYLSITSSSSLSVLLLNCLYLLYKNWH